MAALASTSTWLGRGPTGYHLIVLRCRALAMLVVVMAAGPACESFDSAGTSEDGGVPTGDAGGTCAASADDLAFAAPETKAVELSSGSAKKGQSYSLAHGSKPCPITFDTWQSPRWTASVLNATGKRARVEAWGGCGTSDHELNVVVYKRATMPTTTAELAMCTQASTGYEGNESETPSGSGWCKGLLAKDGQAIELEPCERAFVVFEFGTGGGGSNGIAPPIGLVRLGLL
jgi:hypothetical protein